MVGFKKNLHLLVISSLILLISINIFFNSNFQIINQQQNFLENKDLFNLKSSSSGVNGKPLLINQYSSISNSFYPSSLPTNISFTLFSGWNSKNVNIEYSGVSEKIQRVFNGIFNDSADGWLYKSNTPLEYINEGWQTSYGNPPGCVQIRLDNGAKFTGDYGYYEQNVSIPDKVSSGLISRLSVDYYLSGNQPANISVYLAVIMDGVEKNVTYDLQTYLVMGSWASLSMNYDPAIFGHIGPGNATIRVGVYTYAPVSLSPFGTLRFDNIKFDLWTMPNEPYMLKTFDYEFGVNRTFTNTSYGTGYTFIDIERTRDPSSDVLFTIFPNKTGVLDLFVYNITIYSSVVRSFNTTLSGLDGTSYTFGDFITWETEINFSEYYKFGEIWAEISKPIDWNVLHIYDRDNVDRVATCIGVGYGTNKTTIPIGIMTASNIERPWKLVASSNNYIVNANMVYWSETSFEDTSKVTIGDIFQINVTLNDSITILDTLLNCTIKYPNGTIYWNDSKIISSYNPKFGNFTVGNNMTAGNYQVIVEWASNQSSLYNDKVGFDIFNFIVWHHTNLTALDPYLEILAGDPLLLKVKFLDYDFNSTIEFAQVNFSSTFGQFGSMVYIGSGIYFSEIITNSLELGDYYFSVSATKSFFENQTMINLVHLKIIPQPLALDLSNNIIETNANTIVSCQINVTGSITKTLLWPANISTDWFNPFNVTDHNNGSYTIDFSTIDIPPLGYLQSYTIEIFANKTDYGDANEFLTLLVHPIPTIANVNISYVSVYQDDIVNIKANYTEKSSGLLINGANCSVTWQGSYQITPIMDEFEITLNTTGLTVDYYSVLISFARAGYEVAFKNVAVIINEKEVNISVAINSIQINENSITQVYFQQQINISARVQTIISGTYLSGGLITLISSKYQVNLTELPLTYFNKSIILDGANFESGINIISLRFQQMNYSTKIFTFQLNIKAQAIDLSVQIDNKDFREVDLLEIFYNQEFNLSCRAFAEIDAIFLSGGFITFVNDEHEIELTESTENWFNSSIFVSSSIFSIGYNNAYLRFQQNNYTTTTFSIQIFVNLIEFNATTIGFQNIKTGKPGEHITININITEQGSDAYVENATVYFSFDRGFFNPASGFFEELGQGIYQLDLTLPTESGNYPMRILISKEASIYKTTEFSIIIETIQIPQPNILLWVIVIGLIILSGTLGILSLRTYVILPRKRKKEAELVDKIQVYKDIKNLQALMVIQKESGLPIYTQEIRIFGSDDDSFLVSGFIQAITNFSEVLINREFSKYKEVKASSEYSKNIIELDFNIFQLLVCDYDTVRILIFLREKSSERLKKQLYYLTLALNAQYSEVFSKYSGDLSSIRGDIIFLLNQFLFLHYIDKFIVNENQAYVNQILNSGDLNKVELKLFNIILTLTQKKKEFNLNEPVDLFHGKDEDFVLLALDGLIRKKIIIPKYSARLDLNK